MNWALVLGLTLAAAAPPNPASPEASAQRWDPSLAPPPGGAPVPHLRPCCALGDRLSLYLGPLRAPLSLDNVISAEGLGPTNFGDRSVFEEKNGLLYTCAGGFIDTAHLRASAEWTYWFSDALAEGGTELDLPEASGALQVALFPAPSDGDQVAFRRRLAAQLAFDLALWHELISVYAPTQFEAFGEAFSAFSPEDLYSDALGAVLALSTLERNGRRDFDAALGEGLRQLQAQPRSQTQGALAAVEGLFWNRGVPVPDGELLVRHHLALGPDLEPWRLLDPSVAGCGTIAPSWVTLPNLGVSGPDPRPRYRLELRVPEALVTRFGASVTQEDFPRLLAQAAAELSARHGPESLTWPPRRRFGDPDVPATLASEDARAPAAPGATSVPRAPLASEDAPSVPPDSARFPRRPPVSEQQAIRLLPVELFGALDTGLATHRFGGGARLTGGTLESSGGDLAFMRLTLSELGAPGGLIVHLTGLLSRTLWFAQARDDTEVVAPIAALFRDVTPNAIVGVGGRLFELSLDTQTGRRVVRPLELNLTLNLLGNGLSEGYLLHQLVLSTGLSLDDAKPADGPSNTSLRGGLALFGYLRDERLRYELSGFLGLRQDLLEREDRSLELGLRLGRRLHFRDPDDGALTVVAGLFLEAAYQRYGRPETQLADWILALGSREESESAHLTLVLTLSDERLGF